MEEKNNPKIRKTNLADAASSYLFDLDQRSRKIFRLIVNDFLRDGKPVGSRKLSIRMGEKLSAASVRNVMFDLQESGLLKSIHTSAGRIPTDLGLRFFVDGLLQVGKLTDNQCSEIKKVINGQTQNVEEMFRYMAQQLLETKLETKLSPAIEVRLPRNEKKSKKHKKCC